MRKKVKEEKEKEKLQKRMEQDLDLWLSFLDNPDAKTRKNAALLLGEVGLPHAREALWQAYRKETTRFVNSAYLTAFLAYDMTPYLPDLRDRLEQVTSMERTPENQKHLEEEIRALRQLLLTYDKPKKHSFFANHSVKVLMTTNLSHRKFILSQMAEADPEHTYSLHPLGVMTETERPQRLFTHRLFKELLFLFSDKRYQQDEDLAAALLADGLLDCLKSLHKEEDPFYFRIDCRNGMDLAQRSLFTKRLAGQLETLSGGMLLNAPQHYEVELRLLADREGRLLAALKCMTLEDRRFSYRKETIATSIQPSTAALLAALVKPYLKEDAQILDPFCGVGTMLIERHRCIKAKEFYATDIFGEAIEKGRVNAGLAGLPIHFIHRDFFDFKHNYLFDEIITDLPVAGKKSREEMDLFYRRFFDKAGEHLTEDGQMFLYTNEIGLVKKQLRFHQEFYLAQETVIQKKNEFYLLRIKVGKQNG